jgi:hypothetical protein
VSVYVEEKSSYAHRHAVASAETGQEDQQGSMVIRDVFSFEIMPDGYPAADVLTGARSGDA